MIVTTIDRLTDYKEIPYAQEVIKFIEDFKKGDMQTGRYDIDGDDAFAIASRYDTEPSQNRQFENHKKYIDIQVVLDGTEELHWAPKETLTQTAEEFSKGGDIAFYKGKMQSSVLLGGSACAVLFENDAHKPNVMYNDIQNVLKIVFKIRNNG